MKLQHMKRRVQRGFTLVELAIVLVIAGLILVAVLRGTDAIQKAQVERMVSDLRGLQGILLEFQKRNGRLPGDCDNNGVLNSAAPAVPPAARVVPAAVRPTLLASFGTSVDGNATILDFNPTRRALPAVPEGGDTAPAVTCTDAANSRESNINLPWNELRRAGIVDSNRLPRELARHSMGDVFLISSIFENETSAGVIVVYGIPVWMAEAVDASIDGEATLYGRAGTGGDIGPANTGRVRLWARTDGDLSAIATAATKEVAGPSVANAAYATTAAAAGIDRDQLIAISFQYTPHKLIR